MHPTIIGAEAFHGPVRDGKGWFRLAMVVRLKKDDLSVLRAWRAALNDPNRKTSQAQRAPEGKPCVARRRQAGQSKAVGHEGILSSLSLENEAARL